MRRVLSPPCPCGASTHTSTTRPTPPRTTPSLRVRSSRRHRASVYISATTFSVCALLICVASFLEQVPVATGFFKPRSRATQAAAGPKASAKLPAIRPQQTVPLNTSPSTPITPVSRVRPWFILNATEGEEEGDEASGEQLSQDDADEESEDDEIAVPEVEVPPMMDEEARVQLWMDIGKAENQAAHLTRTGKPKEAKAMLARARKLRRRDPYTTLQKQLDEAVKKEEFVTIARLRLQMRKIGVPPNAELQAIAEGKDPKRAHEEAAKQMGLSTGTNGEGQASSKSTGNGSTVSDGYSAKSVTTTNGVRVEVRSQYYPEHSNPSKDQYVFLYKVKITNESPQTVQLVSRTWEIKAIEATEAPQLVKGPGVVGQQPVLEPGQSFEYSSACPITCAPKKGYQVLGRMKGSYLVVMGSVGEAAFEAKVDPFYLILPQAVLDERSRGGGGGGMAGSA